MCPRKIWSEAKFSTEPIQLLDAQKQLVGLAQFTNIHSGFSGRMFDYLPDIKCPEAYLEGGRMKQYTMDIHQGHLQHFQIIRNNKGMQVSASVALPVPHSHERIRLIKYVLDRTDTYIFHDGS